MGLQSSRIVARKDEATPSRPIITGIGTAWPSLLIGPDSLRDYALKWYSGEQQWVQDLLRINEQTGIETRAVLDLWNDPQWHKEQPPTAEDVDKAFRVYGTKLASEAARKALEESGIRPDEITHMVAVTATNAGSPGYDQIVAREIGLSPLAERLLLSGVGCAGGLAALRVATDLATAASHRNQKAKILIVACELCSIQVRAELHTASQTQHVGIGPALFGDGAAALILCNSQAGGEKSRPLYAVTDRRSRIAPDTHKEMAYQTNSLGFLLQLSKKVPALAASSVPSVFRDLTMANSMSQAPDDYDWALHPGGLAIIKGVQKAMDIPDHALRASNEIYKTRGNSSSVAVLAVLDKLRGMGAGSKNIVACSFGPGLMTEMALLERLA
ncbi:MAG: hypothetical protein Q9165_004472 [Trypethelium subeluteriae]